MICGKMLEKCSRRNMLAFKLTQRTIERWLKQLKEKGLVEFRGAAKTGGYYYLDTDEGSIS